MADHRNPPNLQLRALRENELQMSRAEFAKLVVDTGTEMGETAGCTARLVAAWEDGDVDCPRSNYRRILTQLTGRTMHELGFQRPSSALVRQLSAGTYGPDRQEGDPVDRRAFLADSAGAALSLVPCGSRPEKVPGRVGVADVRAVDQAVTTIYSHDHDHGSTALRRDASRPCTRPTSG